MFYLYTIFAALATYTFIYEAFSGGIFFTSIALMCLALGFHKETT
jgi:hypothetical protein